MFDIETIKEVASTLGRSKLRTVLTGFAVAWGIFMLIVLLAAGNGLKHGVSANMQGMSSNVIHLWPGSTSIPYKGLSTYRKIQFDNNDLISLPKELPQIDRIVGKVSNYKKVSHWEQYGEFNIEGTSPDIVDINHVRIVSPEGRFLNTQDELNRRKVIVISTRMQEILFPSQDPIGKTVLIDGICFQVIGVYSDNANSQRLPAYIPFSTAQILFGDGYSVQQISFSLKGLETKEANEAFVKELYQKMGRRHHFDPSDKNTMWMWNTLEQYLMRNGVFKGINLFLWIVGLGSLMAGVVGVSNIMLVSVRERTREFGIRKAIGATPGSILRSVLLESVFVTALFGYIGLLAGVGLTELIGMVLESMGSGASADPSKPVVFKDPTVDLTIAMLATLVLIIAGVLAGYFPAKKATQITAIEAMQTE